MEFPIGQKNKMLIFRENRSHVFPYHVCQKTIKIFSLIAPLIFVVRDLEILSAFIPKSLFTKTCLPRGRIAVDPKSHSGRKRYLPWLAHFTIAVLSIHWHIWFIGRSEKHLARRVWYHEAQKVSFFLWGASRAQPGTGFFEALAICPGFTLKWQAGGCHFPVKMMFYIQNVCRPVPNSLSFCAEYS
jgi:hypothetical protein